MANPLREGVRLVARGWGRRSGVIATLGCCLFVFAALGATGTAFGADSIGRPLGPTTRTEDEAALVAALADVRAQRLDAAMARLERLLENNPTFRLAHLVYGDLLLARAGQLERAGGHWAQDSLAVEELIFEARQRYDHHLKPIDPDLLPASLLQLAEGQRHAVVVEIERSRLYLFERIGGRMHRVADYYAGAGKNGAEKRVEGDKKTPIGVYRISGDIDGSELPDLYGAGALPIDYPNAWDRLQGYTGSGIWLHGVPRDTYSRSPLSSDGCVTMANTDFVALRSRVGSGDVPVIIVRHIDWLSRAELKARRAAIAVALVNWRLDWQSRDASRYAAHFSKAFRPSGQGFAAGLGQTYQGNVTHPFVQVGISSLNVFAYPGQSGTIVVSFEQDDLQGNDPARIRRQQYWRLEDDKVWRIIYEGDS